MYQPQKDVAVMMTLFGQEVRTVPAMLQDPKERLLTANLVVEEALEFAKALGFEPEQQEDGSIKLVEGDTPNLVDAADAVGDILVVTYGAANRLGVQAPAIFKEVNRSNMTKVWPDGTIHRREEDGKVMKPDTYSPANIEKVLHEEHFGRTRDFVLDQYPEAQAAIAQGKNLWSYLAAEAFGKFFNLTYEFIDKGKNREEPLFAKSNLVRSAAKHIVFLHGFDDAADKLADHLEMSGRDAEECLKLFAQRFPKLVTELTEQD